MAEKEAPAAAPAAPAHEAKPKSSILPLISTALLAVNIAATGFVGWTVMHIQVQAHGGDESESHDAGEAQVATLEPLVVNLNEIESTRYLKTSVEVELESAQALDKFNREKSAVRDEALRYLSNLKVQDTLGEEGKTKIREELATRFDGVVGKGKVKRIFFSEFVVQ